MVTRNLQPTLVVEDFRSAISKRHQTKRRKLRKNEDGKHDKEIEKEKLINFVLFLEIFAFSSTISLRI